jgi:predicted GNAT family acetyltransferase
MNPDRHDDEKLDETLEETFPASDAPANTVDTGIRAGEPPSSSGRQVTDNPACSRFELIIDGHTAFLAYERTKDSLTLAHTEVPDALRGQHIGDTLVEAALAVARSQGLRAVVVCPFARAYLRKHPPSPPIR